MTMRHKFVEIIPPEKELGTLYISVEYGVAVHLCACGCGNVVVTSLAPQAWSLLYDGETVSLYPSIGSYSLPCRSHYWIRRGGVLWAKKLTDKEIARVRRRDALAHDQQDKGQKKRTGNSR
jgi:hypothetical protein